MGKLIVSWLCDKIISLFSCNSFRMFLKITILLLIPLLFHLMPVKHAMVIFDFYDPKELMKSKLETFCQLEKNSKKEVCMLMDGITGPCKEAVNKKLCIKQGCHKKEMSSIPLCKKLVSFSSSPPVYMPLILQFYNYESLKIIKNLI